MSNATNEFAQRMSTPDEQKILQLQRAYEMQKQARAEAEQMLEEKSRELYEFNESLKEALEKVSKHQAQLFAQEKLASIGQLGASLAHELNTPIAFIQNNLKTIEDYITKLSMGLETSLEVLESLSKQFEGSQQAALSAQIEKIRDNSEIEFVQEDLPLLIQESYDGTKRVKTLANSLRYFANPQHSKQRVFDVNESIRQAQTLVRQRDQLINIELDLNDLPDFEGLPMLLSQAIANLIQNAVEATHNAKSVCVSSFSEPERIVIEIKDYGEGLDKATLDKISMPFYTTKENHNGLGLSIAKQIIEQNRGSLKIHSALGEGTLARIELPLKNKDANGEQ